MYKAIFISPMIPSFYLTGTAHFFSDILGFSAVMDTKGYAVYIKDNLTIHILPAGKHIGQMEFYVEVDNIDGLWSSMKEKVKELKVRAPFNRDYGMRELHIEVPYTNTLLFIGQKIDE